MSMLSDPCLHTSLLSAEGVVRQCSLPELLVQLARTLDLAPLHGMLMKLEQQRWCGCIIAVAEGLWTHAHRAAQVQAHPFAHA